MTQDEIIEMARQAGAVYSNDHAASLLDDEIIAFAKLVAERERDSAEERIVDLFTDMETPYLPDIIKAIRARGQK